MGSTSERYVEMLRNFLRPQFRSLRVNMEEMWFQQDGATAHTARFSITVVRRMFSQLVLSRFGDVPWPPRSPDLSACDFFLANYINKLASLIELELTQMGGWTRGDILP